MNKAILVGLVGRDPQTRFVDNAQVTTFTLATTDPAVTLADGRHIDQRTEWHNIVCWDRNAAYAEEHIRRGALVSLEGRIRTRVWEDRSALKHNITEIVVDRLQILK